MTPALLMEPPPALWREPGREPPRRSCDDVLSEAWAALRAEAPAACPFCGSAMEPRISAGAGVVGGRCRGCGTELS